MVVGVVLIFLLGEHATNNTMKLKNKYSRPAPNSLLAGHFVPTLNRCFAAMRYVVQVSDTTMLIILMVLVTNSFYQL
jgi:hypothetical protein